MTILARKPLTRLSITRLGHISRFLSTSGALPRAMKEETVGLVRAQLETCHLLAAVKYNGFSVTQFQELRGTLPASSKLLVAKNVLVQRAVEGTRWAALKPYMKGRNAYLFVHSEEVAAAIRSYMDFKRKRKLEGNEFTAAVFEGNFFALDDFEFLENLPSKVEVCAQMLGTMMSPAASIVGTLQGLFSELQEDSPSAETPQ